MRRTPPRGVSQRGCGRDRGDTPAVQRFTKAHELAATLEVSVTSLVDRLRNIGLLDGYLADGLKEQLAQPEPRSGAWSVWCHR